MATAEQLKYLIESHYSQDENRFTTLALQIAAHEARTGHGQLAHEMRLLIDKRKESDSKIIPFRPELGDLISVEYDRTHRLADWISGSTLRERVGRILNEFRQQDKLKANGLSHRRKLLLCGPPGTGKTMTASVIAGELELPLCTILLDKLVTKFMGETSAKLRQVFDIIASRRGVYLFDEFDAIGTHRSMDNDVGEIRRVLNAFLQLIEQNRSDSLIIAATNSHGLLDHALFRRFDDVLIYRKPAKPEIIALLANRLGTYAGKANIEKLAARCRGLSHADITLAVNDSLKHAILENAKVVDHEFLVQMLQERMASLGTQRKQ